MIPNSPIQKQGKDKESCVKSTQFNRESDIFWRIGYTIGSSTN